MAKLSIFVRAQWDPEAEVWVATSDDVPGLVTEAATPTELERKLQVMIPELLDLNQSLRDEFLPEVPVVVMSEQVSKVRLRAGLVIHRDRPLCVRAEPDVMVALPPTEKRAAAFLQRLANGLAVIVQSSPATRQMRS